MRRGSSTSSPVSSTPTQTGFYDGKRQHFERVGTDLRHAKSRLAERKREIASGSFEPGKRAKDKTTVNEFAAMWLEQREGEVITISEDRTRFERHILPTLGELRICEVETKDIVGLLTHLRRKQSARGKPLAQNTVVNIYANVCTMFADAEQQGYTLRTPCAGVRRAQRPRKAPRSETQGTAMSVEDLSVLISDERIPISRRTFYAVMFLAGLRFGEASGLRWKDYDRTRRPLGHIHLQRQYEDRPLKGRRGSPGPPRQIPAHPVLASALAEWKLKGFVHLMGRHPRPNDFLVPDDDGSCMGHRKIVYWLEKDTAAVGIETKPGTHVARRTFITLATAGGASEAWIRRITHNASGDVLTGYQVNDWPAMCEAVQCVKLRRTADGRPDTKLMGRHPG